MGVPASEEWSSIDQLHDVNYHLYLMSDAWRARREYMIRRAEHKCQVCNRGGKLQLHHRTYARLGHEREADLVVLCAPCHDLFHAHFGVPD
jgi:5-methylcytosine-specific restriction endonuclease McrA